ncbi:sulfotransferase family 2 domain-containing protein [Vreelandella titanicae]|uniref:sulfotransferase family 2 domain-containing protein n=1 Tax=Vreelandella titanicae TaxID=664683 RepID=UPI003D2CA867
MPLFFKENKVVCFLHIPKTGGTSIEKMISSEVDFFLLHNPKRSKIKRLPSPQHLNIKQLRYILGNSFLEMDRCTVVRNPMFRLISEYKWLNRKMLTNISLEDWFEDVVFKYQHDNTLYDNHIQPQHLFVDDRTKVFKFEDDGILNCAVYISKKLDINMAGHLKHRNKSDVPYVITDKFKEMCFDFYKRDFERFGYEIQ